MSRLPIQPSTLKKLFALSGNCCAFPNCRHKLVNEDGNLIAEVCHIEAANIGGERYNSNQTDEERRDFKNLLVMCNVHHKVTDDVVKYPTEILIKMKAEHETKFSKLSEEFVVPKTALEQAGRQVNNFNSKFQNKNGVQNISQAGNQIITQNIQNGLTEIETRQIVEDQVFKLAQELRQNLIHLSKESQKISSKRIDTFLVEEFTPKFISLSKRVVNIEQKLKSPDIQYSLNQVLQAVARREDVGFNISLANLMIARIESEDNSPQALIYNEAISVFPKLTSTQLGILSFVFLAHSVNNSEKITTVEVFKKYIQRNYGWIFNIKSAIKEIDFGHLEYSGCVIKDNPNVGFIEYLTNHFKFASHDLFIESRNLDLIQKLSLLHDNSEIKSLRLTSVGTVLAIHWLKVVANLDFEAELWLED